MHQEVIDEHFHSLNNQKRSASQSFMENEPEVDPEILAALPTNIQEEVRMSFISFCCHIVF